MDDEALDTPDAEPDEGELDEPDLDEPDLDDDLIDPAFDEEGEFDPTIEDPDDMDDVDEEALPELEDADADPPGDGDAAVLLAELDDEVQLELDADEEPDGLKEGEFVCRSCFMAKRESALADPKQMLCRDCA